MMIRGLSIVAFLQKLPELSSQQYEALVAQGRAEGHMHGGERSGDSHQTDEGAAGHGHGEEGADHEHEDFGAGVKSGAESAATDPEHSDGHSHHNTQLPSEQKAQGSTSAAQSAPAAEPIAVVDRFFRDLAAGDISAASSLLDPGVLIYESGGAERSRDEYALHHLGSDAKFLRAVKHRLMSRTGDAVGDLAWVASETSLSGNVDKKPVNIVSTETMVLRKMHRGWRIVHITGRTDRRRAVRRPDVANHPAATFKTPDGNSFFS
jgi:ketosteroid isomerase-like protein